MTKWQWEKAYRGRSIPEGLKPRDQHIGLLMSTYADGKGEGTRPTVATLVRQSGWSPSTVDRARAELRKTGWIELVTKGSAGKASLYRLTIPAARN